MNRLDFLTGGVDISPYVDKTTITNIVLSFATAQCHYLCRHPRVSEMLAYFSQYYFFSTVVDECTYNHFRIAVMQHICYSCLKSVYKNNSIASL